MTPNSSAKTSIQATQESPVGILVSLFCEGLLV